MALLEINRDPGPRELGVFAAAVVVVPAVVGVVLWFGAGWRGVAVGVWAAGAVLAAVYAARPGWRRGLYVAWMTAEYPIGWTIAHAVAAGVYLLIVTPIGLAMRLAGHDPMARRRGRGTMWVASSARRGPGEYVKQY